MPAEDGTQLPSSEQGHCTGIRQRPRESYASPKDCAKVARNAHFFEMEKDRPLRNFSPFPVESNCREQSVHAGSRSAAREPGTAFRLLDETQVRLRVFSSGADMSVVDRADERSRGDIPRQDPSRSISPESDLGPLMNSYQAGDFAAATALIEELSPRLHRFFAAQSVSRRDADDLLQETWMRIHRVRHTWRTGDPLLPLLFAIARRVRIDHYRKSLRTTAREEQVESISELGVPASASAGKGEWEALLAPLPPAQREVIAMLKVAEMTLEEVARATSSTVGAVKQKAHRGYETLRVRLSAMGLGKDRKGGTA